VSARSHASSAAISDNADFPGIRQGSRAVRPGRGRMRCAGERAARAASERPSSRAPLRLRAHGLRSSLRCQSTEINLEAGACHSLRFMPSTSIVSATPSSVASPSRATPSTKLTLVATCVTGTKNGLIIFRIEDVEQAEIRAAPNPLPPPTCATGAEPPPA
jgi:hypothetical protein